MSTKYTLEDIENCILNRKIAELKSFFSEEIQKENVDKMFYIFDKKNRKQVGDEKIVYKDDEYITVRATRAYGHYGWYHSVWVFGVDEQPWVHRLPWDEGLEKKDFEWTREQILIRMRFDKSIKSEAESYTWKDREVVRIQGDLSIRKVQSLQEFLEDAKRKQIHEAEYEFREKFADRIRKEHKNDVDYFNEDIQIVETIRHKRDGSGREGYEGGGADKETLKQLRKKYNLNNIRYDYMESHLKWMQERKLESIVREQDKLQDYEGQENAVKAKAERMFETGYLPSLQAAQKQMNLRAGNHLIVIEKVHAFKPERWMNNNRILVVEEGGTKAYTIHDEHQNKSIILAPGEYEFTLLQRHQMDQR